MRRSGSAGQSVNTQLCRNLYAGDRVQRRALPRSLPGLVQVVEALPVLDRVHRTEEAIVSIRNELVLRDQACERLLNKLFARLKLTHGGALENEEPAVDAKIRSTQIFDGQNVAILVCRDDMGVELRTH